MELVMLGTGAADGWPNPFCTCESCKSAISTGSVRGQTAALVDNRILLDCGPEVPRAATRYGRTLAGVSHILLTHSHPDHLGPMALLFRSWASRIEPLQVLGPADALDLCRDWVGPEDPVTFIPLVAGQSITLETYVVRALAATHEVPTLLYDITDTDGTRIFWATDTGPLPESTIGAIAEADFDALFLEETFGHKTDHDTGHHDLPSFARTVTALRANGAVTDRTDIVAVHLGHHNPPLPELTETLSHSSARTVPDGTVLQLGLPAPHRTLITGGARAGKSTYAESLLASYKHVTYIATGDPYDDDPDWTDRVASHRARRPTTWTTVETSDVIEILSGATEPILLDCLGTWLTARMNRHDVWVSGDTPAVHADIDQLLKAWATCPVRIVAVTNEVGSGVVPETKSGRMFRDLLGLLNARIADASESVVLLTAGIPTRLR
ncbi:bifunctional adenosylcobinamide kinase/adenosylcobinamide-phosphate guanylyltransferase [Rhodococcus sp. IEGM 1379]|uniref:bifunctional adenosylcobinamide kinase/adenosylcobinamide-phosphate guanylyltransferase n=1 Tax=Rhodococcus sp. IEGM 1379 TaxID=3047086 RepID=UPI0024B6F605|nr:bifunctional adenosylcobinamide kinase/adenosylcobinamide-phosphate guanylyltransferase [Rhodococcus sp. IEGM 1379]MDI9914028.1 bifunctional adenosylcobinamide kinase/adenosylcobinamide-phosphate guanylyltransferase [Rhodococcus sp. IEGM 1379]